MEADKKTKQKQMQEDLTASLKTGAILYLNGEVASPKRISIAVFREEHGYMADLVTDEHGCVREIRYDHIFS